jgi:NADH-quinone oxidoreductase subunit J
MLYAIYIASVAGAISLLLMMPRRGYNPRKIGALVGAITLGGLWLYLARFLPDALGIAKPAMIYYYLFSALAIGSAVRVITHTKPVFAALWFVMLVIATAGLFLLLSAEFMAFAMVIIYGGAILVTYVFVIMLAAQATDSDANNPDSQPEFETVAREPVAAIAAGFLLLAMLLTVAFNPGLKPNPVAAGLTDQQIIGTYLTQRNADLVAGRPGGAAAAAAGSAGELDNVEQVGFDLFRSHPLGLELAGVILLVSLVGAVVIARKQVDSPEEMAPTKSVVEPTQHPGEPGPKSAEALEAVHSGPTTVG